MEDLPSVQIAELTDKPSMQVLVKNILVAIPAGLAATGVMTIVMLLAPIIGIPEVNLPRLIGTLLGMSLSVGLLLHFTLGIGVAILFAVGFTGRSMAPTWLQGLLYSVAVWLFLMLVAGPVGGWGLFASHTASPSGVLLTSLLGHLAFGTTMGLIYEKAALRLWSA